MKYAVHWFRRDLRVAGNQALQQSFKDFEGKVVGVFVFDKDFLSRSDFSNDRFAFFLNTLKALKEDLQEIGSDLLVLDVGPQKAFPKLFESLKGLPAQISFSRDYEPFARKRDQELSKYFEEEGVQVQSFRDHLLIEPWELNRSKPGDYYQIYTPFSKKWLSLIQEQTKTARISSQKTSLKYIESKKDKIFSLTWKELFQKDCQLEDHLLSYCKDANDKASVEIPEAGSKAAFKALKAFKEKLDQYSEQRDFPILEGGSKLSHFLKNGSLTTAQIIHYLNLKPYSKKTSSKDVYYSELIWREFYYHILYHRPDVEVDSFKEAYKNIEWQNNKNWFQKWKEGQTGFPIVDAGMRELKTTGFMHNRLRMIVASFLTKDLLIDWRWGEKYFMEKLLDGDLAPNNGGWQWAASTGCDAQPYFRIFNPWSQSKKFDLKGDYIKKFVPELKDVEPKKLHEPILGHSSYPEPIVEHSVQRASALEMYKALK